MTGFIHSNPPYQTRSAVVIQPQRNHCLKRSNCLFPGTNINQRNKALIQRMSNNAAAQQLVTEALYTHTAIIVVDHGSKRKAANDMIFGIVQNTQSRTDLPVLAAHMELAEPTIADAVDECARAGIKHVIIVPFFLSPGRHATEDIPQLTQHAIAKHAGMSCEVKPPIGTHPSIPDVVLDRAGLL